MFSREKNQLFFNKARGWFRNYCSDIAEKNQENTRWYVTLVNRNQLYKKYVDTIGGGVTDTCGSLSNFYKAVAAEMLTEPFISEKKFQDKGTLCDVRYPQPFGGRGSSAAQVAALACVLHHCPCCANISRRPCAAPRFALRS